jgi:hypothetical protein
LLTHLGFLGEAHLGHGLGDIEDDEFTAILQRHKAELENRLYGAPQQPSAGVSVSGNSILFEAAPPVEHDR